MLGVERRETASEQAGQLSARASKMINAVYVKLYRIADFLLPNSTKLNYFPN